MLKEGISEEAGAPSDPLERSTKKRKNPLAVQIGKRLKQARSDAGLKVEAVAQEMKCDRQTVATWESGNSFAPIWKLIKLAELYHVTIQYLALGESTSDSPADALARLPEAIRRRHLRFESRPKLVHLMDALSGLSDEQLNAIILLMGLRIVS